MLDFLRSNAIEQNKLQDSTFNSIKSKMPINIKFLLFLFLILIADSAFAQGGAADAASQLSPMLDKILNSLGGTLGKVIMAVGLLLSALAALAGMNRSVILTPVGIGFLLGNAKTIINWMFS